ncbi:MAG: 4Fe-4S dicluster domain-containing protein [Haliscomenobacteraceae bacterium CHB4]|nr:4Fe-4S dicluster domain-containing protein [Haliscomenobacteraceae bacterium CHB4]
MLQTFLFFLLLGATGWIAWKGYRRVWRNICLGRAEKTGGNGGARWRNVLLVAFGQQKMFKNWLPAVMHLFIYVAFVITQIELIEIFVDGIFGTHRFFAAPLGGFYTFIISLIEILSVLAFVATVVFLARRNLLRVPRFWKPEMKGWPFRDANLILLGEIILIVGIFCMNGGDKVLQTRGLEHYQPTGAFAVSSWLGPMLFGNWSNSGVILAERFGWWLHILTVFGFLCYLPYSKHLHILLAFPNTWYAKLTPKGEMENMPEIQKEVRIMMGLEQPDPDAAAELPEFGADDVFSLSWQNILQAYSCTECGRCTAACPANLTGKKLSPRKVMMDVRDRAEEVGLKMEKEKLEIGNYNDGKSLFDRITPEEIHACTTCNACVEACPVLINPLDIILKMRRHEILTQSAGPAEWLPMFNAIENNGAAWAMSEERVGWRNS